MGKAAFGNFTAVCK